MDVAALAQPCRERASLHEAHRAQPAVDARLVGGGGISHAIYDPTGRGSVAAPTAACRGSATAGPGFSPCNKKAGPLRSGSNVSRRTGRGERSDGCTSCAADYRAGSGRAGAEEGGLRTPDSLASKSKDMGIALDSGSLFSSLGMFLVATMAPCLRPSTCCLRSTSPRSVDTQTDGFPLTYVIRFGSRLRSVVAPSLSLSAARLGHPKSAQNGLASRSPGSNSVRPRPPGRSSGAIATPPGTDTSERAPHRS